MIDPKTQKTTNASAEMIAEINGLLADHFALYIKTKSFHWHVKGPRFRDLHVYERHARRRGALPIPEATSVHDD